MKRDLRGGGKVEDQRGKKASGAARRARDTAVPLMGTDYKLVLRQLLLSRAWLGGSSAVPQRRPGAAHDPPGGADLWLKGELLFDVFEDRRRNVCKALDRGQKGNKDGCGGRSAVTRRLMIVPEEDDSVRLGRQKRRRLPKRLDWHSR